MPSIWAHIKVRFTIVNACVILHNIMIERDLPLPPEIDILNAIHEHQTDENDDPRPSKLKPLMRTELVQRQTLDVLHEIISVNLYCVQQKTYGLTFLISA